MLSPYDQSGMVEDLGGPPKAPPATESAAFLSPSEQPASTASTASIEAVSAEPAPDLVDIPPAVAELRKSDPARAIFGAGEMHADLREDFERLVDPMATSELRKAAVDEMAEVVTDLGANHGDIRSFISQARVFASRPPTAAEETHMQHECLDALRRRFGEDADAAAADARRLVARDPRFAAWIEETGLGNHPATVLRIAELARSERSRGRLG